MIEHATPNVSPALIEADITSSYRDALKEIDRGIVQRLSRGNVRMQMGLYLTAADLDELAEQADAAMARLNKLPIAG